MPDLPNTSENRTAARVRARKLSEQGVDDAGIYERLIQEFGQVLADITMPHMATYVEPPSDVTTPELNLRWDEATNVKNIHYYETIKIRSILGSIIKRSGFPLNNYHNLSYFSGLRFWTPAGWTLHVEITMQAWEGKQLTDPYGNYYFANPKQDYSRNHYMRDVFIYWIGLETAGFFYGVTPFIDSTVATFIKEANIASGKWFPLYETTYMYNQLNDEFIRYNWDKILEQLNEWGY